MNNLNIEMVKDRMNSLGLDFMAAGFESFLSEASRKDVPLLESIADLIDIEYIPRKDRMAKTRLKVSGIPQIKNLEDFDL
jgi:hypothetical protein